MSASHNLKYKRALLACLTSFLALGTPVHADLTLSGGATASDSVKFNKNYTELAQELTKFLGEPVRYVDPLNMLNYGQEIRKGSYDILLDSPQFGAWRLEKNMHKPVVKSELPLTFVIVVPASDSTTKSSEQLIGKQVCVQPSPNVSNLMFMSLFPNPMQMPNSKPIEGYTAIYDAFTKGSCSAAVLSTNFYENSLTEEQRKMMRVVQNTRPLPGVVLTVSNKISAAKIDALQKRLINADPAKDKLAQAMTKAGVRGSVPTKARWLMIQPEELKGLDILLKQYSYGWQ